MDCSVKVGQNVGQIYFLKYQISAHVSKQIHRFSFQLSLTIDLDIMIIVLINIVTCY